MRHPKRGVIPPDKFIPFAEEHGLIARIGAFVLDNRDEGQGLFFGPPLDPEALAMLVGTGHVPMCW